MVESLQAEQSEANSKLSELHAGLPAELSDVELSCETPRLSWPVHDHERFVKVHDEFFQGRLSCSPKMRELYLERLELELAHARSEPPPPEEPAPEPLAVQRGRRPAQRSGGRGGSPAPGGLAARALLGLALDLSQGEVLEVLREAGNVVAVVAGHSHSGGYALDDHGIHHVVVEATLTHETAFGVCECRGDGSITIAGEGSVPSRVLAPPASLAAAAACHRGTACAAPHRAARRAWRSPSDRS